MDSSSLYLIVSVIVGGGLLGGLANFFLISNTKFDKWILLRSVIVGLSAASCVPLFLELLPKDLLQQPTTKDFLVLFGFCVIAAFFSKRFLEDIYSSINRLSKDQEETKAQVGDANRKADKALEVSGDLLESATEEEFELPTTMKDAITNNPDLKFSEQEAAGIVRALMSNKFSLRTTEGISKEANVETQKVVDALKYFQERGQIERRTGLNGRDYWGLVKYPIKIYSAWYGAGEKGTDVTKKVRELVANQVYSIVALPGFLGVEDPARGTLKTLKIHCRINGNEMELSAVDGETIVIPVKAV